jgi:hypothetical protein
MTFTFEQLHKETPDLAGPERKARFEALPDARQNEAWRSLRRRIQRERAASEPRRTDWRYVDRQLRDFQASEYMLRISAREIEDHQRIHCPLPDHDDHSRDFGIRQTVWHCHGCNRGGTIYEFAAHYWERGTPLRGQDFKDVQRELAELFGLI